MRYALWFAVVGSTLSWAAFDGVRKKLVTKIPVTSLAFWISIAQLPGYIVWALWEGRLSVGEGYIVPGSLSILLNLIANVLFLESVRRGPLSVAIPVLSFTPVFAAMGGVPLLGEVLGPTQWLGVSVVTGASVFLTAEPGKTRDPIGIVKGFFHSPGVVHMFGVAILWSFSPLFDKLALEHAAVGVHGAIMALSMSAGMLGYLAFQGNLRTVVLPPGTAGLVAIGGVTNVAALGLQLVSITQMAVSVFEAFKRAAGVLIALSMGRVIFREKISRTRIIAAILMAAGVVLVLRD